MPPSRLQRLVIAAVCLIAPLAGCAEPPTKELSQAQGAIDAARAAGAADYAAAELQGAEQTLARANQSVTERDYRAALSQALDASARAQAAARATVERRVQARLAADQSLDDFAALVSRLQMGLADAEARRVPAATRQAAATALAAATQALQATRQEVERGNLAAVNSLAARAAALEAAIASVGSPPAASRPRKRS